MPVALALITVVVLLAVCLLGILWSLIFLMPFYTLLVSPLAFSGG